VVLQKLEQLGLVERKRRSMRKERRTKRARKEKVE
jgi:predicted transcriptional regulator